MKIPLNECCAFAAALILFILTGCGSKAPEPVDIFPEDACANCRMAISQKRFASEIVTDKRRVHKFDDVSCLEEFRAKNPQEVPAAIFFIDYNTRQWIASRDALIIQTGISTPMGSGRIALADSLGAAKVLADFPPASGSR